MDMILYILFTSLGYTICYFHTKISRKKEDIPKRKGLLTRSFTISSDISKNSKTLEVEFEVLEIESTDIKTKIKVLGSFASNSEYNSGASKDKLTKMVDGSWVDSKDISWIEKSASQKRDDKLNELLK